MNGDQVTTTYVKPILAPRCVICGTALRGPLGYLFRFAGIRRSTRNPYLCNRCNTHTEEGRIVELSVLFADLSAFTELTHKLGPEHMHRIIEAFFQMATQVLVQHGAFIDKYLGDGVMAFFNVPIHMENHAVQAVAAALEIQAGMAQLRERFGLDLNVSTGVMAGWARVGSVGSRERKDYTAIGDVVNLAARLEGQARPGEILIHGSVYAKVAASFPDMCSETLALKGFQEPVVAYRLCSRTDLPPHSHIGETEREPKLSVSLGAAIFAILGAPCAAVALVGPLAITVGIGTLFGAISAYWSILDAPQFRLTLLILSSFGSLANLYTLWRARAIRLQARKSGNDLPMTSLERRRTVSTASLSAVSLAVVASEVFAHIWLRM